MHQVQTVILLEKVEGTIHLEQVPVKLEILVLNQKSNPN